MDTWLHPWWRHQMEIFSALLAFCAGNSPVPGEFPAQRPVTRSFEVFFGVRPNKRLSKQPGDWWSETPSSSLWRHRNAIIECGVKLLSHSQTTTVQPLKFENGLVIPPHTLLGVWLLIHARIRVNHVNENSPCSDMAWMLWCVKCPATLCRYSFFCLTKRKQPSPTLQTLCGRNLLVTDGFSSWRTMNPEAFPYMALTCKDQIVFDLNSITPVPTVSTLAWWRHQMETFSALVAFSGNSPVTGDFLAQRPLTRSFDVTLICTWTDSWANNADAGDLRRYLAHYDVIVMDLGIIESWILFP